ncbi:MAG: hypothetical protein PHN80_14560 [Hespellia sp.]|nr:hypothetical protein [Hespellia sp.]
MKRVFGTVEMVFDILYLCIAVVIGCILLFMPGHTNARILAGIMALVLAGGDSFHLIPRIRTIAGGESESLNTALGRGKQITSITMTIYYLLLWHIGVMLLPAAPSQVWTCLIYLLAAVRIALCFSPQNKWLDRYPPVSWGIYRNIPFFLMGIETSLLFLLHKFDMTGLGWMWLAILLSFAFYLPVVLWANKNPKIGMLMLPKTCVYVWMLVMCLSL